MTDNFCVMPFFGAEYTTKGFTTPCCLLDPTADIQQVQADMLDGKKSSACDKCWRLEEQGKTSDRMLKNSAFDYYTDRDIRFVKKDCADGNFSPKIIKLYTSNLCNSTCITCGPAFSTAWATLTKQKTFEIINIELLEQLDYSDIIMLTFVGGEPLYEKTNFSILEKLIEAENQNCFISFVTNGSTRLTKHQKDILSHFTNLNVCLSIDGIQSRFEYIRYPLQWTDLLENLNFYRKLEIDLSVSYTISNLNILYYDETIDWFEQQQLTYNHNLVTYPTHFNINSLPKTVKHAIGSSLFRSHEDQDDQNFKNFLGEIQRQDQLKNIRLQDYLPELSRLIF